MIKLLNIRYSVGVNVLRELLQNQKIHMDPNVSNGMLLFSACVNDQLEVAQLLIDAGADLHRQRNLSIACLHGHTCIAHLLLDKGVKVHQGNWDSLIHITERLFGSPTERSNETLDLSNSSHVNYKYRVLIIALLEAGADPLLDNAKAYHNIMHRNELGLAKLIRDYYEPNFVLGFIENKDFFENCILGKLREVKIALEKGKISPNIYNALGLIPLSTCEDTLIKPLSPQHLAILMAFLDKNVDIHSKGVEWVFCAALANEPQHAIVELLVDYGIRSNKLQYCSVPNPAKVCLDVFYNHPAEALNRLTELGSKRKNSVDMERIASLPPLLNKTTGLTHHTATRACLPRPNELGNVLPLSVELLNATPSALSMTALLRLIGRVERRLRDIEALTDYLQSILNNHPRYIEIDTWDKVYKFTGQYNQQKAVLKAQHEALMTNLAERGPALEQYCRSLVEHKDYRSIVVASQYPELFFGRNMPIDIFTKMIRDQHKKEYSPMFPKVFFDTLLSECINTRYVPTKSKNPRNQMGSLVCDNPHQRNILNWKKVTEPPKDLPPLMPINSPRSVVISRSIQGASQRPETIVMEITHEPVPSPSVSLLQSLRRKFGCC